jgi:hypothetical protein
MVRRCHAREPGGGVGTMRVVQGLVMVALMLLDKQLCSRRAPVTLPVSSLSIVLVAAAA